jgi:hypothetical protein
MANEISINLSITASKNGAKFTRQESFKDDITGDAWTTGVQQVSTNEQITDHGDITTYGWIYLKNMGTDSALYVDFGRETIADATDKICRLYGGESCIIKTAGLSALWAVSSSGTQAVEYAIIEL